jgi:cytochrome c oxidase subunit I
VTAPARAPETAVADAAFRRELWGWSALAVGALAIAGVFALLLAISRIPGIETVFPWPLGFFHKGLVIHVVFSFVVWFLAVFGALLLVAAKEAAGGPPRFASLGKAAVAGMVLASPLLFVPALLDRGEPTLNNYVPVIIDPLYYAGLVLMAVSMALAVLRLFLNLRRGTAAVNPMPPAMAAAGLVYAVALVCFAVAYALLAGEEPSHGFNEELFWGGGHVLQFLNTLLLVVAWSVLAAHALGPSTLGRGIVLVAAGLLALSVLPAPFFYLMFEPFSADHADAFTNLQYALAPPTLLVAGAIAARLNRPLPWREPAFLCLVLSVAVFAAGGVLGLFVDGADTRTPAHYHGVIAGVTLAFMGLFYITFLPLLERSPKRGKLLFAQIYLFAGGQLAACIGLFLAGGFGAPRKTAGEAQGLEEMGAIVGMTLNGIGALFAIVGGILFIWMVAAALLKPPHALEKKRPTAEAQRL